MVSCRHPVKARKSSKRANFFSALLKMLHRNCRLCRAPLHAADGHGESVSCLGATHAETALTATECTHCVDMCLTSLRSRRAFFLESDSASRALPLSSAQGKSSGSRGSQHAEMSELTPAQTLLSSLSATREADPVFFSRSDQLPVQDDCCYVETDPLANMPRALILFPGSKRRLLSHPDSLHHRPCLRFTFKGVAYQYTVLPFGLSLAPQTFTKCMDTALPPLRKMGIRILDYLDDWLVLAQTEVELLSHRSLFLSHLDCLGLKVNLAKSALSPSQRISFLGTVSDSVQMRAVVTPERGLTI